MTARKINGGLYLVVNARPGVDVVLPKVQQALAGGVDVIQIWCDQRVDAGLNARVAHAICEAAHAVDVPVLVYEQWTLLKDLPLDGVHFDQIPADWHRIKQVIGRRFMAGITCGNDLQRIDWAIANQLDYISFCSVFDSSTAGTCELVRPELIAQTRTRTSMPIYAAGGITQDNVQTLLPLGVDGVAIVSGIMAADEPKLAAIQYKTLLSS